MSNVNPRTNQLQTIPPKDADKDEKDTKKEVAPLEEDDEFEDFPVEDWNEEESQKSQYMKETAQPLWAEEWEDETEETDFAVQLKQELEKVKNQNSQKMQT